MLAALGRRFRTAGWWAIGVLLVTGTLNIHFKGLLQTRVLTDPAFWTTAYGHALAWKLTGVTGMIAASAVHDFILGPRASSGEEREGRPDGASRKWASWAARLNALLGIAVVVAAVYLARSG